MQDIWRLSATELASLIRAREKPRRRLWLNAVNPKLNAVVDHRPQDVLAQADAIDATIANGGDVGILAGVPITVKVIVDQAGFATTSGGVPASPVDPA